MELTIPEKKLNWLKSNYQCRFWPDDFDFDIKPFLYYLKTGYCIGPSITKQYKEHTLNDRTYKIFSLYILNEKTTLDDCASVIGITRERIRRILLKTIRIIKYRYIVAIEQNKVSNASPLDS